MFPMFFVVFFILSKVVQSVCVYLRVVAYARFLVRFPSLAEI